MITLEMIESIGRGLAWGAGFKPYTDGEFEISVTLPFPFFEAVQREIEQQLSQAIPIQGQPMPKTEEMRFMKLSFPSMITAYLIKGDDAIIIERKHQTPVVPMNNPGSNGLRPRA